ncbi:tRNA pseudouridine(38-40) synthase TruA, partial [Streptomyces sp. ND04-05B]|nr:tRNA pseudouridine(38-40) synthase TruA [Streptomyces sp. ND04-05B]
MSDEAAPGHVRVRLDLSYDGSEFSGWAKQAGG